MIETLEPVQRNGTTQDQKSSYSSLLSGMEFTDD